MDYLNSASIITINEINKRKLNKRSSQNFDSNINQN